MAEENWTYLRFNLIETKKTGETLSNKAKKMVGILNDTIKTFDLDSTEETFLNKAVYHYQILASIKPFADIAFTQEANPHPAVIMNNFDNLNTKIIEDKNGAFLLYTTACACLTRNSYKLTAILNKIYAPNEEEKIKNCELMICIQDCLISPVQQLPRLALFSNEWCSKLGKAGIISKSVENLKATFENITVANNSIIYIRDMEKKQKEKEEADSLLPSFFRLEGSEETVLNDQAIKEMIQQVLGKNKLISLEEAQTNETNRRQTIIITPDVTPEDTSSPNKSLNPFQLELMARLERKKLLPLTAREPETVISPISSNQTLQTPIQNLSAPPIRALPQAPQPQLRQLPQTPPPTPPAQPGPAAINFNFTTQNNTTIINIINVYPTNQLNTLPPLIEPPQTPANNMPSYPGTMFPPEKPKRELPVPRTNSGPAHLNPTNNTNFS